MFEKDELYEWLFAHKRENGSSPLRMANPRIPTLQYRPAKKKKTQRLFSHLADFLIAL